VGREVDQAIDGIRAGLDRILSTRGPIPEIGPAILRTLGEGLSWDVGMFWQADEPARVLRFVCSWHDPSIPLTELERLSSRSTFSPGVGLPGRILSAREPAWLMDVQNDLAFPRRSAAMEDDLQSGFGFPLLHGRTVVGVIELFSHEVRPADHALLASMVPIGAQIGQMLGGEGETS
jgi:hypothetical protein